MNPLRFALVTFGLLSLGNSVHASVLSVVASVNGTVLDEGLNGTFDSLAMPSAFTQPGLYTQYYTSPENFERRSLLEFDLSGLAPSDTITSVTFRFAYSGNGYLVANPVIPVRMVGYAADGVISLSDATLAGSVVVPTVDFYPLPFGAQSVAVDPNFVQSLLGSAGYLGLRIEMVPSGAMASNFGINSQEADLRGFSGPHPTLDIEYTRSTSDAVPETSNSLLFLTSGCGLLLCARRRLS